MANRLFKTPMARTRYCWVQEDGYSYKGAKPYLKSELIFTGADGEAVKTEADEAIATLLPEIGVHSGLKHKIYSCEANGDFVLKTKRPLMSKDGDGNDVRNRVTLLYPDNSPIPDDVKVGAGSLVEAVIEFRNWKFGDDVGVSARPQVFRVYEIQAGEWKKVNRSEDEWADFMGEQVESPIQAPAEVEDPAAEI